MPDAGEAALHLNRIIEWQGEMKTHGLSLYENPLVTIYRKLNIEKLNFKQLHVVGYQKYTKVQGYLRNI